MNTSHRFVANRGSSAETVLSDDPPWAATAKSVHRSALALGWRCSAAILPGNSDAAADFLQSSKARPLRSAGGYELHLSAQEGTLDKHGIQMTLLVDLWIERRSSAASEIMSAIEALNTVRKQVGTELQVAREEDLRKEQEFLEIRLPHFTARHLDTNRAKAAIAQHLMRKHTIGDALPSLRVAGNRLTLGPEPNGVIDAVLAYLRHETSEEAKEAILVSRYGSRFWLPLVMAGVLLLAWGLPLRLWSVAFTAGLLLVFMFLAVRPAVDVGWQTTFRDATTVATFGFFGIGIFGLLYAGCALAGCDKALNSETARSSLGYSFLMATGLGIAGGIVGDNPVGEPTSWARIIAHIQLLLFLTGVLGVVALLLRIGRGVARFRG